MLDKITTIRLSETPRTVRVSEITVSGKDIFESAVCREKITNLLNSDLKSIRGKKNQIDYFNKLSRNTTSTCFYRPSYIGKN